MNSKTITLIVAVVLILIGLVKPDFSKLLDRTPKPSPDVVVVNDLIVEKPTDEGLLAKCDPVIAALKNGAGDRKSDGKRLASLYLDMATLISLDGEDLVIRNTEEIRQANSLSGLMLKLDMKGKYPDLANAAKDLVVTAVGDDNVDLDKELRNNAVLGFKALAWACNEGAK